MRTYLVGGAVRDRLLGRPPGDRDWVVVGATVGAAGAEHDLSAVNGPLLAPGIGAQGATAADLRAVFGAALPNVLPSSSREVLSGGPTVQGLREAAQRTLDQVLATLPTG
mgnify:CR=1 FL=1